MTIGRLITQIRFWILFGSGYKRADYARKKGIFAEIGEGSKIPLSLPLYPKLVKIHNNVIMHRSVELVTHDMMNKFLVKVPNSFQYKHLEYPTPIEIMDNVYVGMNVIIMGNVRIGSNVIITAGSVVTSDIPPNSVVSGIPAKVVGDFDMYSKTRVLMDKATKHEFHRSGKETIDQKTVEMVWQQFENKKNRAKKQ